MSAKPEMGQAHPHVTGPRNFADNLASLQSVFPDYPQGMKWELKKSKRLTSIETDDPIADATLFAALASIGYISERASSNGFRRNLADGTIVGLRITTSSKGSPAVDLNISSEKYIRKIHFTKKEAR